MAIYHHHAQIISRSSGRSSVAAAAYRSGTCLTNERDGVEHDYSRRRGVDYANIVLPDWAPVRWLDRSTLWNEVEQIEKRSDAQLCREINYALPRELDFAEQQAIADEYAKYFVDQGMVVDYAIHGSATDNPHVHMMLSMRPCSEEGFLPRSENLYLVCNSKGEQRYASAAEYKTLDGWSKVFKYKGGAQLTKDEARAAGLHPTKDRTSSAPIQKNVYTTDWNTPEKLVEWREKQAQIINSHLLAHGIDERVSHESYKARGLDMLPTVHEGPVVRKIEADEEAKAKQEGRPYEPVTDVRRENVIILAIRKGLKAMLEKALRIRAQKKNQSAAAKRYAAQNRSRTTAARKKQKAKAHSGLSL